jgi:hypothetical protein
MWNLYGISEDIKINFNVRKFCHYCPKLKGSSSSGGQPAPARSLWSVLACINHMNEFFL